MAARPLETAGGRLKAEIPCDDLLFLAGEEVVEWRASDAAPVDDRCDRMIEDSTARLIDAVRGNAPTAFDVSPLRSRLYGIRAAEEWCASNLSTHRGRDCGSRFQVWMVDECRHWIEANCQFNERLDRDRSALAELLRTDELAPVRAVQVLSSDVHDDGGYVSRVSFMDGSVVIYKPRSVSGEFFWHKLSQMTREADADCAVHAAKVLRGRDGEEYGWMEDLAFDPAPRSSGETHFWESAGSLICHAVVCGLTDLHFSNMIATTHSPGVADAECLGTPGTNQEEFTDAAEWLARACVETGLIGCGRFEDFGTPDVSGLFGGGGEVPGVFVPSHMAGQRCRTSARLKPQQNRFRKCSPLAVLPHLVRGFCRAARALTRIAGSLTRPGGWCSTVQEMHEPRVIVLDTLRYGLLMSRVMLEGQDSLDDALAAEQRRHHLRLAAGEESLLRASELRSLGRLHIPRFHISADTGQLMNEERIVIASRVSDEDLRARMMGRLERIEACSDERVVTQAFLSISL